jgi:alkanesulfonate monooxygenase SsuD/methylene tetrahydromethanopterin reductase-like flavin-dependent oxidoreductase (luciferase family)
MDICLMVEGQEDVTWEDWLALAADCEEHGVGTMFRSDHYLSVDDRRERGSLDAWETITALGAGWWEREHELYGFDLPEIGPRMEALEEQMQIVRGHWEEGPFSFEGRHYRAQELDALPKPVQRLLPLILGGRGGPRSLRMAARYADEYNTVRATAEEVAEVRAGLDRACEDEGRDPATLPLSMMTVWLVGADRDELLDRAARLSRWKGEDGDGETFLAGLRESAIQGTAEEAIEQLRELEAAGLTRVMGQHLLHRDLVAVALMGREIAPRV